MSSLLSALRRHRLALCGITVVVLAYALTGFLLVPRLLQSAAQQQLAVDGRQLTIARVAFNPFSLEARVEGFMLKAADGAPMLAFDALTVNAGFLATLWRRAWVLEEVHLEAPYVGLVRAADGSINLSQLLPPPKVAPDKPANASLPRIRIGSLQLDRGKIDFKDLTRAQAFTTSLGPIEFGLKDFSTALSYDNAYQLSIRVESGEQLDWSGEFSAQPLASSGHFALHNLQVKTVESYLQEQLPVRLLSGVGAVEGTYRATLDPSLSLDLELPLITLKQFALGEKSAAPGAIPPLLINEVRVKGSAVSLARHRVTVRGVEIDGAQIHMQREADGSLSLSRLLPPARPEPAEVAAKSVKGSTATAADLPWKIALDRLAFSAASVAFDDHAVTPAAHVAISPISFTVDGYRNADDARLKLDADLQANAGARLKLAGDLQLQPLNTTLKLDLSELDLPLLQAYVAPYTGLRLKSGRLGAKLQIHYASSKNASPQLSVSGEMAVANFVSQDPAQQDFLKWRQLRVDGIQYQQSPQKLSINRIALSAPYARVIVEKDQTLNIAQVLSPATATAKAAASTPGTPAIDGTSAARAAPKSKPMPLRINTVTLDRGTANFADLSIDPQFATGIVGLTGKIVGLSTDPESRARLHLEGRVDQYSPVVIGGEINPISASKYADVDLSFRNMDLTTFNPYSGRFAGYNIVKGKLTTELKYKIVNRQLDAQHHVVIDSLEFGSATGSKQAVPLPVRLAVALLKDRHGIIDLDLPVGGSLDDPTFRVGPIVWKVFVNLLTKVVTSPFAAIGALAGGGEELSYVDFAAGSATLNDDEGAKLGKLATALVERPQLRLDVPLTVSDADKLALARLQLAQRAPAAAAPSAAPADRVKALEKLYRELAKKSPEYPDASGSRDEVAQARSSYLESELLQRLSPDAAILQQLAKDRAQAVQAALLSNPQIVAERIFITGAEDASAADGPVVRVALKLE